MGFNLINSSSTNRTIASLSQVFHSHASGGPVYILAASLILLNISLSFSSDSQFLPSSILLPFSFLPTYFMTTSEQSQQPNSAVVTPIIPHFPLCVLKSFPDLQQAFLPWIIPPRGAH